jgi:hypothetical protein
MTRDLSSVVRRVLLEQEGDPQDPSYWREVGKTVGRYGSAIGGAAGSLAKATLDTFVGQANAPGSEEDVRQAQAARTTLLDVAEDITSHLVMTKFRIGAKIADAAGFPVKDIIAGKAGEDALKDIFAGSVLHDILLAGSFVPGGAVPSMLLDSVVYAAEGDEESAAMTLALAGVFHAGGKIAARRADDAARGVIARKGGVEILAPKGYKDLTSAAKSGRFTHAVPPADRAAAAVRFIEDVGGRMSAGGVSGGNEIASQAAAAVRSGEVSLGPALNATRAAESQAAASELMTPGAGGVTPLAAASRLKRAYDDIRAAAKRNLDAPELVRYADRPGRKRLTDLSDEERLALRADELEGGRVPEVLSPKANTAGRDILRAWKANADEQFFKREVKTVHWLGFSSFENRSATKALDDFLEDAAVSKNVQISTIGYAEQVNPGPRAGVSFRTGPQKRQIQVGIKLKGDVVYATSEDAFTTNPRDLTRAQVASAKAGVRPPPTFTKVPRPRYVSDIDVAMISDPNNPLYDAKLRAEMLRDIEAAKEAARANFDRTDPANIYKNPTDDYGQYLPSRWNRDAPARAFPAPENAAAESMLMLDRESWREPFVGTPSYNEVVLDEWAPDAIYLNPVSATKEQIGQIKAVADKHGLKLLDLGGGEINMSDFEPRGRSGYPLRQSVDPESTTGSLPTSTRKGRTVYTGIAYPVKETALREWLRSIILED